MAAGDVVNTAARLQAAAPGRTAILVGETTYRATRDAIEYARAPSRSRRRARPSRSPVWEALEARARFGVDVAQAARTPLVGRERELDAARRRARPRPRGALAAARDARRRARDRQGRLVYELSRSVDAEPELISWRQGRSLPYGEGVTLLGARRDGEGAGRDPRDRRRRARPRRSSRQAVADAVPDEPRRAWVERHLRPLVGLGGRRPRRRPARARRSPPGGASSRRSPSSGRSCSCSRTCTGPTTACSTSSTTSSTGRRDVPLLVVAHRAAGAARAPARLGRRQAERDDDLALAALGRATPRGCSARCSSRPRARGRAPGGPARAGRRQPALRRAVRAHARRARRRRAPPLPETVQGIIAARLDALAARGEGAAPGRGGGRQGLLARRGRGGRPARRAGASRSALHALERKEFVRRERRSSVAGETEYAFRHVLVRDVAYGQIPRAGAAEKHRRAAEWIEALGRPEDHAELLAHHYAKRARARARRGSAPTPSSSSEPAERCGTPATAPRRWTRSPPRPASTVRAGAGAARSTDTAAALLLRLGGARFAAESRRAEELEAALDGVPVSRRQRGAQPRRRSRSEWSRGTKATATEQTLWLDEAARARPGSRPDSAAKAKALVARGRRHARSRRIRRGDTRSGARRSTLVERLGLDAPHARVSEHHRHLARVPGRRHGGLTISNRRLRSRTASSAFEQRHGCVEQPERGAVLPRGHRAKPRRRTRHS